MQIIEDGYGGNDDPIKTKVPKGRASDGKVNISLNPETVALLASAKDKMAKTLGFSLTYSQAIQHLIAFYNRNDKTECQDGTLSQPTEGEVNE